MDAPPRASHGFRIFFRALIWSLVGLIYAPLFTALKIGLYAFGLGAAGYMPAAALAGAVGAAFYGARQVALVATGIGLGVASLLVAFAPQSLDSLSIAGIATLVGVGLGLLVRFPDRCSRGVPGKALAGLTAGLVCGSLLALAEATLAFTLPVAAVVAFLVSVNGILYVVSVRWWVELTVRHAKSAYCNLIESIVIGILAACAATALWLVAGPLLGLLGASELQLSSALHREIPLAIMGGLLGGAVGGALLEAFRFRTVFDL